ncbi:MAG: hypothetical protein ACRDJ5_09575 [Actinomycetota bacterium]
MSIVSSESVPVQELLPARRSLPALREAAASCTGCDLYREDLDGKPFVDPAGRLLDRALEEAGVDRSE